MNWHNLVTNWIEVGAEGGLGVSLKMESMWPHEQPWVAAQFHPYLQLGVGRSL